MILAVMFPGWGVGVTDAELQRSTFAVVLRRGDDPGVFYKRKNRQRSLCFGKIVRRGSVPDPLLLSARGLRREQYWARSRWVGDKRACGDSERARQMGGQITWNVLRGVDPLSIQV